MVNAMKKEMWRDYLVSKVRWGFFLGCDDTAKMSRWIATHEAKKRERAEGLVCAKSLEWEGAKNF